MELKKISNRQIRLADGPDAVARISRSKENHGPHMEPKKA